MTPKEKAKEFVEKFKAHSMGFPYTKQENRSAKQCALIAVDEIINTHQNKYIGYGKAVDYWQQVKTEITEL